EDALRLLRCGRGRPAVRVVAMGAPDGAWQGETNLSGPDLLVVAHRGDQLVHPAGIRTFDGQVQTLEDRLDASRCTRGSDPQRLRDSSFINHPDRDRFAVQDFVLRRGFDRVPNGVPEVDNRALALLT